MIKRYNLYTFTKSKFIYTETENLKQALYNFNRRLNLDHNGNYHPQMEYNLDPMRVITTSSCDDENEKIISFNRDKLNKIILKQFD
jgi:hypothetical protein